MSAEKNITCSWVNITGIRPPGSDLETKPIIEAVFGQTLTEQFYLDPLLTYASTTTPPPLTNSTDELRELTDLGVVQNDGSVSADTTVSVDTATLGDGTLDVRLVIENPIQRSRDNARFEDGWEPKRILEENSVSSTPVHPAISRLLVGDSAASSSSSPPSRSRKLGHRTAREGASVHPQSLIEKDSKSSGWNPHANAWSPQPNSSTVSNSNRKSTIHYSRSVTSSSSIRRQIDERLLSDEKTRGIPRSQRTFDPIFYVFSSRRPKRRRKWKSKRLYESYGRLARSHETHGHDDRAQDSRLYDDVDADDVNICRRLSPGIDPSEEVQRRTENAVTFYKEVITPSIRNLSKRDANGRPLEDKQEIVKHVLIQKPREKMKAREDKKKWSQIPSVESFLRDQNSKRETSDAPDRPEGLGHNGPLSGHGFAHTSLSRLITHAAHTGNDGQDTSWRGDGHGSRHGDRGLQQGIHREIDPASEIARANMKFFRPVYKNRKWQFRGTLRREKETPVNHNPSTLWKPTVPQKPPPVDVTESINNHQRAKRKMSKKKEKTKHMVDESVEKTLDAKTFSEGWIDDRIISQLQNRGLQDAKTEDPTITAGSTFSTTAPGKSIFATSTTETGDGLNSTQVEITTTTTTTTFMGPTYESVTNHPEFNMTKIFYFLNTQLHNARNTGFDAINIDGYEFPLELFRCFGPDGFIGPTTTSTTPPPVRELNFESNFETIPGGSGTASNGVEIAISPQIAADSSRDHSEIPVAALSKNGELAGIPSSVLTDSDHHDTEKPSEKRDAEQSIDETTARRSTKKRFELLDPAVDYAKPTAEDVHTFLETGERILPMMSPTHPLFYKVLRPLPGHKGHTAPEAPPDPNGDDSDNEDVRFEYRSESKTSALLKERDAELERTLSQGSWKEHRGSIASRSGSYSTPSDSNGPPLGSVGFYGDGGQWSDYATNIKSQKPGRQLRPKACRTTEGWKLFYNAYDVRWYNPPRGRDPQWDELRADAKKRRRRDPWPAYDPRNYDLGTLDDNTARDFGLARSLQDANTTADSTGASDASAGDASISSVPDYYCLIQECIEVVDLLALSGSGHSEFCAKLPCRDCVKNGCVACEASSLGMVQHFCMSTVDLCEDLRWARPFTDFTISNAICPDQEFKLEEGVNDIEGETGNVTSNATKVDLTVNPWNPNLLADEYIPYIIGGLTVPMMVFVIFFLTNRYQARIRKMKTFNAAGMKDQRVINGDFTGLKQFFPDFLEDFLTKSKASWDEELEYLQSEFNTDKKAAMNFRKTLKFCKANQVTYRHLDMVGRYMTHMPYLMVSLHSDWQDADEKTLDGLCHMIRESYSEESLREFRIRCRVEFSNDILKLPQHMTSRGRESMDEIAELLYHNASVNCIRIPNTYEKLQEKKKHHGKSLLWRFIKHMIWGSRRSDDYIYPEENNEYEVEVKTKKRALGSSIVTMKKWDPVDLYRLRQILNCRVDARDMNWGLIGATCYLGACKAVKDLRVVRLRNCNLNDGVADTILRLCMKTHLIQLVLSNNYFSDRLIARLAVYVDHESSRSLKGIHLDRNLITGVGFRVWKELSKNTTNLEELTLGTEFFGNPLMGDRGTSMLCLPLSHAQEIHEESSDEEDMNIPSHLRKLRRQKRKEQKAKEKGLKEIEEPIMIYKFQNLRTLRLCNCKIGQKGSKSLASWLCHHSSLTLKALYLDGNPIGDGGLMFLMKAFCHRLKVRAGGAHGVEAKKQHHGKGDLDDIDDATVQKIEDDVDDEEMDAANFTSMLDLDLDEDYVLHQCERKAFGVEPILDIVCLNDCLLRDDSLRMLMIFIRTERLNEVSLGGHNPMSTQMRSDIHLYNNQAAKVQNLHQGFVTTKQPIKF